MFKGRTVFNAGAVFGRRSPEPRIPGPSGGLLGRHVAAYEADPPGFLTECRERYGDVFRFDTGVVVVTDPALVQQVLTRTNRDSVPNTDTLRGRRFPTEDQTRQWMRTRQAALPGMRPAALPERLPSVAHAVAAGLAALEDAPFDPAERAWEFSVRALLPLYLPRPDPALQAALLDAFAQSGRAAAAGRVPRWWPSRLRRELDSSDQRLRDRVTALLEAPDDRSVAGEGPVALVQALRDRGEELPADVAQAAVSMTALGALGTMGGSWCWLLYQLAAQDEARERIRAEVTAADSKALCTHPERVLPYTTSFVHEVLRVHPPAWLLGRDTITRTTLAGFTIPPKTAVMVSPYLLHHDPRWWRRPERFDPGRWSSADRPHAPYAYLPFGAGPRGCMGAQLGLSILLLTAAHLCTGYTPHVPDLDGVGIDFGPTLLPTSMTCRLTRAER
ncbi:cytochrome P450 [Actinomadura roseirufa]|uniref:cytochrome P450 n=1 Tax=Actinomadura roseirufa TaxID=2094049 RepID=UPI0013F14D35|nr:cytochrome P450 [Actinomadura roseirufa]